MQPSETGVAPNGPRMANGLGNRRKRPSEAPERRVSASASRSRLGGKSNRRPISLFIEMAGPDRLYTNRTFGIIRSMTKAIIYTRVSTSEQGESGLGLDAQAAICEDYCARNRLEIVELKTEIQSGKSTRRRPVLAAALESLRKREAEVLIASNVSRLSRSIGDLVGLIAEADKRGYSVVALDTGLDTSTPAGRMVFQMLGVAAEYERAMTSDRTKKALARAKAKGTQLGRRTTLPKSVIDRIAAERASGRTLASIAYGLNAEQVATGQGGVQWYPATVSKVLSRAS